MTYARVLFRGEEFEGELLYLYTFPWKRADERGHTVVETQRRPQRVGLRIAGVDVHFTMPTSVVIAPAAGD
jgi:hypothetical protein